MKEHPDYFATLQDRVSGKVVEMTEEEVAEAKAEENTIAESAASSKE